jgi:hypothetical protein
MTTGIPFAQDVIQKVKVRNMDEKNKRRLQEHWWKMLERESREYEERHATKMVEIGMTQPLIDSLSDYAILPVAGELKACCIRGFSVHVLPGTGNGYRIEPPEDNKKHLL